MSVDLDIMYQNLEKFENHKGFGVLTKIFIPRGTIVLLFKGPIYDKDSCPDFGQAIQVDVDKWMGSSGGLDDLVNHSCNPNLGILQAGDSHYLVAIKNIEVNEELTWDYSTSMVNEPWDLENCKCGSHDCRRTIQDIFSL